MSLASIHAAQHFSVQPLTLTNSMTNSFAQQMDLYANTLSKTIWHWPLAKTKRKFEKKFLKKEESLADMTDLFYLILSSFWNKLPTEPLRISFKSSFST